MKTIAFFNNKGGVGKTSLIYHLAWMCSELNHRVIVADLDPQANLSSMFLSEKRLVEIWDDKNRKTINEDISPLFKGSGDISSKPHIEKIDISERTYTEKLSVSEKPYIEKIDERIGLLVGDLALSKREDELSTQWHKCLDGDERAFRVTTAFARLISHANEDFDADIVLIDVGPNLGAISRASLIASDHVVIPLALDLFLLQELKNVGPTLKEWRKAWNERLDKKPEELEFDLPKGSMQSLGYIIMRYPIRLSHPVKAYARWIEKIPSKYRESVLQEANPEEKTIDTDEHLLVHLKDYSSLMPLAQEAKKPMFMLKPADGVIRAQNKAVIDCYKDFDSIAKKIMQRVNAC